MAKDPATLWYWNDWQGGTTALTRHLKGCYMDLLHAQFNLGRLSLAQIKTVLGQDYATSWPILQEKFIKDESGKYYNEKAEQVKEKRAKYSESRRNNLKPKIPHMETHMKPHMENEIENETVIRINGDSVKGELSDFEVGKTIEYSKITLNRDYDKERTLSLWRAFLIQTEGKFYPSNLDRIQHFRYWIKTQPYQKPSLSVEELRQLAKKMDNDNTPGI